MRKAVGKVRGRKGGFTLVEVLAALLLVAIVLPVTMRGVTYATNAATAARRRNEASGLAQSKLDELLATQDWTSGSLSGDFVADGWPDYSWSAELAQWTPNGLQMSNGLANNSMVGTASSAGTTASAAGSTSGTSTAANASSSNNTLQELDLHVTWTDHGMQQTLTLSTLVYQSGNSMASSSGTTTK